jgi:Prolipoprotein diacylglyceryl transferase
MANILFILTIALGILVLFRQCFKSLPKEKWQIIGAIPKKKIDDNTWLGMNLTYYGFFNANAYTFATALIVILLGALEIPVIVMFTMVTIIFAFCMPASRIVARIVEKKPSTFSVGGAFFVGMIIIPWLVWLIGETMGNQMGINIQILTVLAAVSIAYAFGEGIGRLACISFGCCYGKPLSEVPPFFQKLFRKKCFIFCGKTKKIAYAHGYDNQKVLPIQAVTAIIFTASGLLGLYLFFTKNYDVAFFVIVLITQGWRFLSEFLRADYRGERKISAYQIMGICSIPYAAVIVLFFPTIPSQFPNILIGLQVFWNPGVIIFLESVWLVTFLFTGRSEVTGATISFHIVQEKI